MVFKCNFNLSNTPIFLDNFVDNWLTCSSQFSLLYIYIYIYIPRNLVCLIWVIWWTFSELFIRLVLYLFLLLQNIMKLVLDTFRERRFAEDQSLIYYNPVEWYSENVHARNIWVLSNVWFSADVYQLAWKVGNLCSAAPISCPNIS